MLGMTFLAMGFHAARSKVNVTDHGDVYLKGNQSQDHDASSQDDVIDAVQDAQREAGYIDDRGDITPGNQEESTSPYESATQSHEEKLNEETARSYDESKQSYEEIKPASEATVTSSHEETINLKEVTSQPNERVYESDYVRSHETTSMPEVSKVRKKSKVKASTTAMSAISAKPRKISVASHKYSITKEQAYKKYNSMLDESSYLNKKLRYPPNEKYTTVSSSSTTMHKACMPPAQTVYKLAKRKKSFQLPDRKGIETLKPKVLPKKRTF